jgi:hypothetical protein
LSRLSLGIAGFLLQTALMMGVALCAVRRWVLPVGSLALAFGLNAAFMSLMHDQYHLIPGAALAGLVGDLGIRWLNPSTERAGALRLFALTVPMVYFTLYYVALIATHGLAWSVHVWTGSIVLSGIVGLLLSYVLLPPPMPSPQVGCAEGLPAAKALSPVEMPGRD